MRAEDSRSFPRDFQGFGVELGLQPPSPGVGRKAQGLPQARSPSGIAPRPRGLAPAGLASAVAAASPPPSQPSTAAPRSSRDFAVATSPACAADAGSDTQPPGTRTAAPPPGRRAETTPCRTSTAASQSPHPRCFGGPSRRPPVSALATSYPPRRSTGQLLRRPDHSPADNRPLARQTATPPTGPTTSRHGGGPPNRHYLARSVAGAKGCGRYTASCLRLRRLRAPIYPPVVVDARFAVLVEKDGHTAPVYLHGLTLTRLYEDVVVPYEEDKPFFVDGVPIRNRSDLKRLKIIRQDSRLTFDLFRLYDGIKRGADKRVAIPTGDYPGRLIALFQESREDVTSSIVNAYQEKKPLKLPLDKLIEAASAVAAAAIKARFGG
jgi:hypothetical protein